jgi:murein DD-endopeptidase MepM/ murein hydrolase activator NlpD
MSEWRAAQPRYSARHQGRIESRGLGAAFAAKGFTVAYAGRQIRFGPVGFWIAVGAVVIMAGWSLTTATYFAFRDDVLRGLMARQADQQYAYEDRIAELRARLDRTTSRQLLDQEQFEQKLDDLLRRQGALESRAAALAGINEPAATTGSLKPAARTAPEPLPNPPQTRDHQSFLDPTLVPTNRRANKDADVSTKLGRAETSLERVERREVLALAQVQERYEGKVRRLRGVLADLGLKLATSPPAASGGPFVPIKLPGDGNNFERALMRVKIARAESEQLNRALIYVPVRKPVVGEIDLSSPFGARMDPFLHIPAMHTGIDFRGEAGDPIRATAAGTVTAAGWSGGYGKMVEIDHGNGLVTRYGHLSRIDVDIGEKIKVGHVVGRMGSTGRSTGPHVHYETRIDGEAVDPQRFLNAGGRLGSASD